MAVTNSGMTLYTDNDTQQSWAGSDDLDLEVSKDGGGSESWLIGKNSTETATLSLTVNLGTPKYVNFWMKSDWGSFYTDITAKLIDGTNTNSFIVATGGKHGTPNLNPEISGDFKPSIMQVTEGSAGGTYVPANHTQFEVTVDASSSGNIRSITNHWIDGIWYGNGRTISGTPTAGNVFLESHELDTSNADYDGCSVLTDAGLVYYTDVTDSTASESSNASVVFNAKSTTDGTLNLNVTGASTYSGMSFSTEGVTDLNFLPTNAGFSMAGGQVSGGGACTLLSGQTYNGVVFNNRTSQSIPSVMTSCAWTSCGLITLTGTISGGSIKESTGAVSVLTADLGKLTDKPVFTSDGANHAVELSSIGGGAMDWDCVTSGYDAGATGSPVTPTSTGNEDIYVSATTGTITINVQNGATTPSIRSAGAIVNVVAGLVTATFNVSPAITGYEYALYTVTAAGSLVGAVEVQHVEVHNSSTFGYTYTYSAGTILAVQLLFGDGSVNDFEEYLEYITLSSVNQTIPVNLTPDNNN